MEPPSSSRSTLMDDYPPATAPRIEGLLRTWLARLPHPFTPEDRAAGYRYDLSILQAEFALTQVLDRPLTSALPSVPPLRCWASPLLPLVYHLSPPYFSPPVLG